MITRLYMPFLPEFSSVIMYGIFMIALIIFCFGIRKDITNVGIRFKDFFLAVGGKIKKNPKLTAANIVRYLVFQKKTQATKAGKLLHSPIFFGFLFLFLGTALVALDEDILNKIGWNKVLTGFNYLLFESVLDTAGIVLFFGLIIGFYRRAIQKKSYIHSKASDYWILGFLLVIVISGFLVEALRLKLEGVAYAKYSYLGNLLAATIFKKIEPQLGLAIYPFFWYFHLLVAMSFIAIIPYTKLRHLLFIPFNLLLSPPKLGDDKVKISTPFNILEIDEDNDTSSEVLDQIGVGSVEELNFEDRVQIYSCVNCGRCEEVCPAHNAGRSLSPRNIMQKINNVIASGKKDEKLFETLISHEEMWGCTNCYACIEACPSFIRHVDHFINFRRSIVNNEFEDETKISIFENIDRNGNPYGLPSYERLEWLLEEHQVSTVVEKEDFEFLYFVGCSSSYDQRCQEITKACVNILNAAGVSFAVLEEERCCGEPAKRMGEEGLFQMTAIQNIELFESFNVKKILVNCPHCYNMLKHEYKDFNGHYQVIHHSELIMNLIETKKLNLDKEKSFKSITYHDPCNLSRLNGIISRPRKILSQIGELKEMDRCKEKSFCCGGGGGNSFYKVNEEKRISHLRLEEALKTGASIISTSCPFCMSMFEDAKGDSGSDLNIADVELLDIAEIVSRHIEIK